MKSLMNKRIVVGVCGGIAAYKSADLVRRLRGAGAEVRVVMTRSATEFVTPLTFQSLSGHPVHLDLFDPASEAAMGHIALARWADAVLVAPATADFIAQLTEGRADELLGALCLAGEAPLALAPAMNRAMWAHPATQANVEQLALRGVHLFGPASGEQACGESGPGRMLEPDELVLHLTDLFAGGALAGLDLLITAGPTREALDPVRYLSNHSSGKMGYALAAAAVEAGARVTLVSGPVCLPAPERVERVMVESALQMHTEVMARVSGCDLFIACAAVADYRPAHPRLEKIKKAAPELTLELVRNPDILAEVAALPEPPFTVGFAAETVDLEQHARAKLEGKRIDLIAANLVGGETGGFGSDDNALAVFWLDGRQDLPLQPKPKLARALMALIAERYGAGG